MFFLCTFEYQKGTKKHNTKLKTQNTMKNYEFVIIAAIATNIFAFGVYFVSQNLFIY